jgi:TPR repeat protein
MSPRSKDANLDMAWARNRAYRSDDPMWWSNLAAMYATTVPARMNLARKWYGKAAHAGDPRGLFEYGLMLLDGEGGPGSPRRGRTYLKRAARLGQIDALKVLAHTYAQGERGFPVSRARAKRLSARLRRATARRANASDQ